MILIYAKGFTDKLGNYHRTELGSPANKIDDVMREMDKSTSNLQKIANQESHYGIAANRKIFNTKSDIRRSKMIKKEMAIIDKPGKQN